MAWGIKYLILFWNRRQRRRDVPQAQQRCDTIPAEQAVRWMILIIMVMDGGDGDGMNLECQAPLRLIRWLRYVCVYGFVCLSFVSLNNDNTKIHSRWQLSLLPIRVFKLRKLHSFLLYFFLHN